ncbi:allophanate hydrolase [Novosphingobium colocasiae]|uniref:allophanate hydrolase n=1 Tax=Novosphingobium colocasiae TaxID=1256513 RepID=UPI0035B43DA0
MTLPQVLMLDALDALYREGRVGPADVMAQIGLRIDAGDPAVFITRTPPAMIDAAVADLLRRAPEPGSLPLWGVPFAVKDNIDVAGLPTTCACPAFARPAQQDAAVVARLIAAGAIVIGKTNLDQFATGLNGTRSPYGAPRSVFSPDHISGGSSSGSGVAVAAGMACFSLGTDTAGSGRVPAAFNNLVGIKPTPGLLSTAGLVPACASLDCISVFALSVGDGARIRRICEGYDPADPWSQPARPHALPREGLRIGVLAPADRDLLGSADNARLYADAISRAGGEAVEIDYAPFAETAALLYDGPWVAERQAAFAGFGVPAAALDPSVAVIFAGAARFDAVATFAGLHRLAALRRACAAELDKVDVLLLPTTPGIVTVAEMLAEPIARNTRLGRYTNFCNLLGLSAIAVPAGFAADGLPFGVTLVGPAFADEALVPLADRLHRGAMCGAGIARDLPLPACSPPLPVEGAQTIELAVVGAHLSGMPLNPELLALGATLSARTRTSGAYRLYALPGTVPPKPGLIRVAEQTGDGIEIEIWALPAAAFGLFVSRIAAPLGIGKLELADGGRVSGFLCEAWAAEGARDITAFGGWRAYCASLVE